MDSVDLRMITGKTVVGKVTGKTVVRGKVAGKTVVSGKVTGKTFAYSSVGGNLGLCPELVRYSCSR